MKFNVTRVNDVTAVEKLKESPYVYLNLIKDFMKHPNFNVIAEEDAPNGHFQRLTTIYKYLKNIVEQNPSIENQNLKNYFVGLWRERQFPHEIMFNAHYGYDLVYQIGIFTIGEYIEVFEQAFGQKIDTQSYQF